MAHRPRNLLRSYWPASTRALRAAAPVGRQPRSRHDARDSRRRQAGAPGGARSPLLANDSLDPSAQVPGRSGVRASPLSRLPGGAPDTRGCGPRKRVERVLVSPTLRDRIRHRLADEVGRIHKQAPFTVALCYPSPYSAGMSSLGYQRVYRALMDAPGLACERAFLDDECESDAAREAERPVTYEALRPIEELPGARVQRRLRARDRRPRRACSNAAASRRCAASATRAIRSSSPAARSRSRTRCRSPAFVDAIVIGEADALVVDAVRAPRERRRTARGAARPPRRRSRTSSSRRATSDLPPVGAEDDADPARALGDPHAEHRARRHVPHRDRARLLARLHLLRDAPLDQRRHAHRAEGEDPRVDPRRRAARRPRRRGGERSPEDRVDRRALSPSAAARSASRPCGPIASPTPTVRRRARARRLPHAHHGDGRHRASACATRSSAARAQAPRARAPSSRSSTAWTGSSST